MNGCRRRRLHALAASALLAAAIVVLPGPAGGATLDSEFGTGGKKTVEGSRAHALAMYPTGDILTGGCIRPGTDDCVGFSLQKFLPDGTPDPAFGVDGAANDPYDANNSLATPWGQINAITLLPDGGIVAAGEMKIGTTFYPALGRYTPQGEVAGRTTVTVTGAGAPSSEGRDTFNDAAVVDGGKILAVGCVEGCGKTVLARFDAQGVTDTTFAPGGTKITGLGGAKSLATLSDGRFLVAGACTKRAPDPAFPPTHGICIEPFSFVDRYLPDGNPDTTFAARGRLLLPIRSVETIALQSSGAVIIAGQLAASESDDGDYALVRVTPEGHLDPSFGTAGFLVTDFNRGRDRPFSLLVAGNRIFAAGSAGLGLVDTGLDFGLAAYTVDGQPVADFGVGGKLAIDFGGGAEEAHALQIQPCPNPPACADGRMVVVGFSDRRTALARINPGAGFVPSSPAQPSPGTGAGDPKPPSGTWQRTAAMHVPRWNHTATLLADGRVLVVGGDSRVSSDPTTVTEIYDPRSGSWSLAAPAPVGRAHHTATLLDDGRVLVAGGQGGTPGGTQGDIASGDLYDPSTNSWTSAGTMPKARFNHAATRLADGRVLLAGGGGDGEQPCAPPPSELQLDTGVTLRSTEIFTPGSGFAAGPDMSFNRHTPTATLLGDGRVLIVGGERGKRFERDDANDPCDQGGPFAPPEVFVPASMSFGDIASNEIPRLRQTAALLADGRVLVTGGNVSAIGGSIPTASTEIFQPAGDSWSPGGSLDTARISHASARLTGGHVLVAGGFVGERRGGGVLASAEVFDTAAGRWRSAGSMHDNRQHHAATLLPAGPESVCSPNCGKVLVTGGRSQRPSQLECTDNTLKECPIAAAELYSPAPRVDAVSPDLGPVQGGTPVKLTGHEFFRVSAVKFGDVPAASFTVVSHREIVAVSPPHPAGDVHVRVVTDGGPSEISQKTFFTYFSVQNPPPAGGVQNPPPPAQPRAATCPAQAPAAAGPSYPGGVYSLVGLPGGAVVPAQSPLYGWFDQASGDSYSQQPAAQPVAAGRGYWAWFACPAAVNLAPAPSAAVTAPLGRHRASMVGNPYTTAASVSGHDYAARWDHTLNDGLGGYRLSAFRRPELLNPGFGVWIFAYRTTEVRITPAP